MKAPRLVKLVKLSGKTDSSYPVGSIVEGPAWTDPKPGEEFMLDGYIKTSKNERFHWFHTTPLTKVEEVVGGGYVIHTQNSTWRIEYAG